MSLTKLVVSFIEFLFIQTRLPSSEIFNVPPGYFALNTNKRKKYLELWQQNVDIIFSNTAMSKSDSTSTLAVPIVMLIGDVF